MNHNIRKNEKERMKRWTKKMHDQRHDVRPLHRPRGEGPGSALEGVASVRADLEGKCATVTLTRCGELTRSLTDAVTEAGYEVVSIQ